MRLDLNGLKITKQELDEIYDKLVKLRHEIAVTLGYKNFIELGYYRMGRSDYGPKEVSNFRKQIVEYVVPIVSKLQEQKKDILGLDKLYFYDGINFKDGDPKPKGTPEHLVNAAQEMYHELSPETGKFFDTMVSEELMDLVNRDGKRPGGFCTSFLNITDLTFSLILMVRTMILPFLLMKLDMLFKIILVLINH